MNKKLILTAVIKKELNAYASWCPELDVASQGDNIEDAKKNLKEAVELYVETMIEEGNLSELLDKVGLTRNDLKKEVLLVETFSGSLEIPIAV